MGGKESGGRPGAPIIGGCIDEVWRRYKAGEAIVGIAQATGYGNGRVYALLRARRGIAPAPRRRSARVLSLSEREEISRGLATGLSFRAIARGLKRAACTVSQEVARHGGRLPYRAAVADARAWQFARRPKRCVLACNRALQRIVAIKLAQDWSPQQIAGWLKEQYPDDPEMWV